MFPLLLLLTLPGISCKSIDQSQKLVEPKTYGTGTKPEDMTHNQAYIGSSYNQVIERLRINQYQHAPEQPLPQFVTVKEQLAHQQFLRDIGRTLDSQHDILDIEKLDLIKAGDKAIENFDFENGTHKTNFITKRISKTKVGIDPSYTTVDGKVHQHTGYRKIVHQNGICLTGEWRINQNQIEGYNYSGLYKSGTRARIILRGSPTGTDVVPPIKGLGREAFSFGYAGKIFPTMDPNFTVKTANFFVQTDLGGQEINNVSQARILRDDIVMKNAPGVTALNKKVNELPILIKTGSEFEKFDNNTTERQLYQISKRYIHKSLGKTAENQSNSPRLMKLIFKGNPSQGTPQDFRKEILEYLLQNDQLVYKIFVAQRGEISGPKFKERSRAIGDWQEIGEIVLTNAYVSDGCDRYLHFQHPPWRNNNDDGTTKPHSSTVRPYHKFKHSLGEGAVNPHYQQQLPPNLKK